MSATFNKPDFELFNNYTYVILGDGCMQEGVASEAASLAGYVGKRFLSVRRVTVNVLTRTHYISPPSIVI